MSSASSNVGGVERDITLTIQIMFIERHDWSKVTMIDKEGKGWTQLEQIQKVIEKYKFYSGRMDIMLINLWEGNYQKNLGQWIVQPTSSGKPDYSELPSWIKDRLTRDDFSRAEQLNRDILAAAEQHGIPIEKILPY